ncbi:MAG TPA: glycosyltransferase family 4 protein [Cyclobacteriaceae bacterium]|jgi:glycosyltransferase involved in cell wall biosynthesis|nr:glycosyltransferase family 4 protein [Cyclobacteriaceae bacterium]
MKVAIVLNTSWNIYNFRKSFVKALIDDGHEVHTIAPFDKYTHYLIQAGCTHHPVRMDSRGANPIKDLGLVFELGLIYFKVKPDVVLHFTVKPNVYGTLAASLLGIPVINNVCGLGTVFLKKGMVSSIAKLLYKISFRFPKKVFFQNPEDKELFVSQKLVSPKIVGEVPGSGINPSLYSPSLENKGVFTFLVISRLIYDKGIAEYIEAIRILKANNVRARFLLLGAKDTEHKRGIPAEVVDGWIKAGDVEYLGKTDDVRPYIDRVNCVVLPSYREGSPRSLMEAACMSKPLIATDVPGCRQVIDDGKTGMLCKVQDANDLALKMMAMLEMPDENRISMGEAGRKKMENEFSDSVVIETYRQAMYHLYDEELEFLKKAS